ncbi:MAG: glucoamylase family protein, partial [Chloroflexota bacterium]
PTLFLKSYPNTLLEQSCQIAVNYQISYAGAKKVPWGISESSYYYFDSSQIYQYRAFGAPALGYKRDLDEDMVITPYASILALPFATQATMRNIEVLKKLNMCGLFGLYEALDFTSSRLSVGQEYARIRSYMAHHQGMILMALDNYLLGNILVNRFHADPRIKNIELLLQEKTPLHVEAEQPDQGSNSFALPTNTMVALDPWSTNPSAPYPQIHSLSNGNYSLLISASGSGYSRWGNIDLTRWRSDSTLDNWGTWLYIRDDENGQLWSATSQPTAIQPESQKVTYYPHKVEFERRDGDISINLNLTIAADEDVEVRRLTLTNHGDTPRILSMTSYAEVILTLQENDRRHPAFNRMFIESEYIKSGQILLFHRRPRSSNEKAIYLAHFVTFNDENSRITGYETDRASFLGQGNTPFAPISLLKSHNLSGSTGATLDPIFALQTQINLQPYESIQLAYVTLAASSRKEALQLALQYKQWRKLENAFVKSAFEAENEMAQYKLTSRQIELFQKLLSAVLYPASALRADPVSLSANILGQSGLWPFSISGDCPILLARITTESGFQLLTELFRAHTYWRRHGLMIDLVILNRQETSYQDDYTGKFQHLLSQTSSEPWINKRGGIFILREDQINPAENILLITAARVVLDDANGSC